MVVKIYEPVLNTKQIDEGKRKKQMIEIENKEKNIKA